MRIAVIGKNGQLAWELARTLPKDLQLSIAGRDTCDLAIKEQVEAFLQAVKPDVVINCAAYTAVDKAESDSLNAYALNELGVRYLVEYCAEAQVRLIHISTDFVFDGAKGAPYQPSDAPNPLSVYGASKLAGEQIIQSLLPNLSIIVRTSWVYSTHGNNFVKTILRLAKEKSELNIVADQVGSPTWAKGLALWIWQMVQKPNAVGIYHWSDSGVASWFDFALAIQEIAVNKGVLDKTIPIHPIPTEAYPVPAIRPKYSVLDKRLAEESSGLKTIHWRSQLASMLDELNEQ